MFNYNRLMKLLKALSGYYVGIMIHQIQLQQ